MSVRPLNAKLQELAIKELNENPEKLEDDLKTLEDWASEQPHLNVRKEHQWLVGFLRASKFDLQKAKERLDNYYTIKTKTPKVFANKDPLTPAIQSVLDSKCVAVPAVDAAEGNNPTLFIINCEKADHKTMSLADICKTIFISFDILLHLYDHLSIAGQTLVLDMQKLPLAFITQVTPAFCKSLVTAYVKGYPIRIKGIYFINCSVIYEFIVDMVKLVMNNKLIQRVKVFREGKLDQLYDYVPLNILPKEYGGEAGTWDELTDQWRSTLEQHRDWLVEDENYFCDESKRSRDKT